MVLTQTPDAVALLPLQPQQCLVLTNDDLLPIVSPRCGPPAPPPLRWPRRASPWIPRSHVAPPHAPRKHAPCVP